MKKLLHFIPIVFIIFFNSCNSNKKENNIQKNQTVDNYSKIDFSGHTLIKVIETDSGRVLYKPCGANVEKFKIYSDSIFHNLGQEYYTLNISSKEVLENEITYRLIYKYNSEKPENSDSILKIQPLDKNQKFWKINNDLYIDSVFVNTIKTVKELPCDEECYDCPEAKDVLLNLKSNNHIVGKWVVNSCESPIGITINKKGDMVICVDPNQYYIHLSNINGGTKYKLNRFEGIGSQDVFSDVYMNDKAIVEIQILDDNRIEFKWLGFYNKVSKKRQYTEQLIANENPVILSKCN